MEFSGSTSLVQGEKKARHDIDVARIQLSIKSQEYEEARTRLERNLATCEQNLTKISKRIEAFEEDRASWVDQTEYLATVKANWLDHATKGVECEDFIRQSEEELRDCERKIAAVDEILETGRAMYELWRDKKSRQDDDLERKRANFERRQARWQVRLGKSLKDAEEYKTELAQVVAKIQGTT